VSLLTPMKVLRRGPFLPAPYRVASTHKPTLLGKLAMERWVAWSRSVDDRLKTIAQLRTSAIIGCMW
jgi:hypothetical protein